MRQQLAGVFFLQRQQIGFENGIRLRSVRRQRSIIIQAVAGLERPVDQQVDVNVNALFLERMDQIIQPVEADRIQLPGRIAQRAFGILENIGVAQSASN